MKLTRRSLLWILGLLLTGLSGFAYVVRAGHDPVVGGWRGAADPDVRFLFKPDGELEITHLGAGGQFTGFWERVEGPGEARYHVLCLVRAGDPGTWTMRREGGTLSPGLDAPDWTGVMVRETAFSRLRRAVSRWLDQVNSLGSRWSASFSLKKEYLSPSHLSLSHSPLTG